jgi:uncharacterized protein
VLRAVGPVSSTTPEPSFVHTDDTRLVADQGVDALFAGKDAVGGGDRATKRKSFLNRLLPERITERHARGGPPTN